MKTEWMCFRSTTIEVEIRYSKSGLMFLAFVSFSARSLLRDSGFGNLLFSARW